MFKFFAVAGGIYFLRLDVLVLGLLFGYALDAGVAAKCRMSRRKWYVQKQMMTFAEEAIMRNTFGLFVSFIKIDGVINKTEIAAVEYIMHNVFRMSSKQRKKAIQLFNSEKKNLYSPLIYAGEVFKYYQNVPGMLESYLEMLLMIAIADGELNSKEEDVLVSVVKMFNIDHQRYLLARSHFCTLCDRRFNGKVAGNAELAWCYAVLRCSSDTSDKEIKKRYRRLVHKFHPDKISDRDLNRSTVEFASEQFRVIQHAYETIQKARSSS